MGGADTDQAAERRDALPRAGDAQRSMATPSKWRPSRPHLPKTQSAYSATLSFIRGRIETLTRAMKGE